MVVELCNGRCACCDKADFRFAEHSTCHGLSRICNTWHIGRRVFWFFFVLASMGLLTQQLYERVTNFIKFDMKSEIAVETLPQLALPSVTICNMNMFTDSLLTDMDLELLNVSTSFISWMKLSKPTSWEQYWIKVKEYEQIEKSILNKYNQTSFTVQNWLYRTGWQLNSTNPQTLLQCYVGRQRCYLHNFKKVLTPQGLCYTLNWEDQARFWQKLPGLEAGFNILIDIDQLDYTAYKLDSLYQYECGAKVLLHEPYDLIYSGTNLANYVGLEPGMMGFISARKNLQIQRNEWPWSECDDSHEFSKHNCLAKCTAEDTLAKCNCQLWFENNVTSDSTCGVARSTACLIYKETVNNFTVDNYCHTKCLEGCNETSYRFGISYTLLTSMQTVQEFGDMVNTIVDGNATYSPLYIKRNLLSLQIAYPDLVLDTSSLTPAFPTSAFISDLGGQLGLFAGISIITIAELLEYPIVKIYSIFTTNRKLQRRRRSSSLSIDGDESRRSTESNDGSRKSSNSNGNIKASTAPLSKSRGISFLF